MKHRSTIAFVLLALSGIACASESHDDLFPKSSSAPPPGSGKADSPTAGASCKGKCSGASEDESCWCDPGCEIIGDCCADFSSECPAEPPASGGGAGVGGTGGGGSGGSSGSGGSGAGGIGGSGSGGFGGTPSSPGSCAGHCGGPSADGSCYCDQECPSYGDCCADVGLCGPGVGGAGGGTSGACTAQLCNTDQPASSGGQACYCDALCMQYGDCCANKAQVCGP